MNLIDLIKAAPWREAVTYRETWPHEYVLLRRDKQQALFAAICQRIRDGEACDGTFFSRQLSYLFIGNHKYWFMTPCNEIDLNSKETDYILNRVNLYRDRRDFHIQEGDTGWRKDYPGPPQPFTKNSQPS